MVSLGWLILTSFVQVNIDLCRCYNAMFVHGCSMAILNQAFCDSSCNLTFARAMAWPHQFLGHILGIYLIMTVALHYVHVHNKRMVLEDYSEQKARNALRVLAAAVTTAVTAAVASLGVEPKFFRLLSGAMDVSETHKAPLVLLFLVAAAVNIALRVAIIRERRLGMLDPSPLPAAATKGAGGSALSKKKWAANIGFGALMITSISLIGTLGIKACNV